MKNFLISVITSAVVAVLTVVLVGGYHSSSTNLGGISNLDQLALYGTTSAPTSFTLIGAGPSATTTIVAPGGLCIAAKATGQGTNGWLFYSISTSTGNASVSGWATSTTPCY